MLVGIIIVELVGVVFMILAKKISDGKIELIHDYHWKNVREKDKPFYTKEFSKGIYVIGIGLLVSGVAIYMEKSLFILIALFGSIIAGGYILNKVQKKYNGSWFS